MSIDWIREHSRIYGLLSAIELDWSQHNPWYRAFVSWTNHPKKFAKEWPQTLATLLKPTTRPAFDIKFFEDAPKPVAGSVKNVSVEPSQTKSETKTETKTKQSSPEAGRQYVVVRQLATAPAAPTQEQSSQAPAVVAPPDGRNTYRNLITRTFGSLLQEMKDACARRNCQFAVVAIPVRAGLCPIAGMETKFCDMDYQDERQIVSRVCRETKIPYYDVEHDAESLPAAEKPDLFYAVHLTRAGQKFIADDSQEFIRQLIVNQR
jgi:hypothetical protein